MDKTKDQLIAEIRYAIRLCQRTSRLYKRIQTAGTFLAIIGGSATMTSLSAIFPPWLSIVGAALLVFAGAAQISIRPADKIAANETDIHRYRALKAKAPAMSPEDLAIALEEARQSDAPEVEPLRLIAYNDIMLEIGHPECIKNLTFWQRMLSGIA